MSTYYIRLRKGQLHCPMRCATCKKEIESGEKYKTKGGGGYDYHLTCDPLPQRKPIFVKDDVNKRRYPNGRRPKTFLESVKKKEKKRITNCIECKAKLTINKVLYCSSQCGWRYRLKNGKLKE